MISELGSLSNSDIWLFQIPTALGLIISLSLFLSTFHKDQVPQVVAINNFLRVLLRRMSVKNLVLAVSKMPHQPIAVARAVVEAVVVGAVAVVVAAVEDTTATIKIGQNQALSQMLKTGTDLFEKVILETTTKMVEAAEEVIVVVAEVATMAEAEVTTVTSRCHHFISAF